MFSSFDSNDDLPLPKVKEIKGVSENYGIPLDCIGIVLTYCNSGDIFKNMICTSKAIENYLKRTNPNCTENILFKFSSNPIQERVEYVKNLIVDGEYKDFNYKIIEKFPNLTKFVMRHNDKVGWSVLDMINPNLEKLEIENCEKFTWRAKNYCSKLKNLKSFSLITSHLVNKDVELSYILPHFKQTLESLELSEVIPKDWNLKETFPKGTFKNLRILKLRNIPMIKDDLFEIIPKLKVLRLEGCNHFMPNGFGKLKNLESFYVSRCSNLFENSLKKEIGEGFVPVDFTFIAPRPLRLMGRIARRPRSPPKIIKNNQEETKKITFKKK